MKFKTRVDVTYGRRSGEADISWTYVMETREWGIKFLMPSVPDQTISFETEDDDDNIIVEEIELKDIDSEIDGTMTGEVSLTLSPIEIDIRPAGNGAKVTFQVS